MTEPKLLLGIFGSGFGRLMLLFGNGCTGTQVLEYEWWLLAGAMPVGRFRS